MELPVRAGEFLNLEEEYNNALRSQSNVCFLSNTQQQELIPPVVQNAMMHQRTPSEIELALADYFDASADDSEMCNELLRNIRSTQSNYQSMDGFLASMADDGTASTSGGALLALNPFCTSRSNFKQIHDKYSSILRSIRSSHRKVARKHKVVKALKKLSKACLVIACGETAVATIGAAAHLLFVGLMVGPAAMALCPIALGRRLTARTSKKQTSKTGSLLRLREQLDTAAKGTYVLGKDLDTVSQLVARLSDDIERENAMARFCLERAGEKNSVLEMVSELRKSCSSSTRLAEELDEHVCLCIATIQRARVLVIEKISKQT